MSVLNRRHEEVTNGTAYSESTTRESAVAFSVGQVLGGIAGFVLALVGLLAVVRAGVDSTLNDPVVGVAGFHQSAAVGLVELVLGLLLIAGAASVLNRPILGVVGGVTLVAGVVVAAENARIAVDIGATRSTGWFAIAVGAVAMLAAMLPTAIHRTVRTDVK